MCSILSSKNKQEHLFAAKVYNLSIVSKKPKVLRA